MSLSAQQAAEVLGVSRMQVSRLVRQGDLRAHRLGHALVIDADSVRAYRELRPGRGRPLSPRAAWERIAAESGHLIAHSSNRQALDAARQLAIVARRRADRRPYRVLPNRLAALLADERVVLSGADAGDCHGAPVRPGEPHPVYLSSNDLDRLVADHRLRHDETDPNVILRVVDPLSWILDHRVAPPLVAAIDAIDEGDARSAAEIVAHALHANERAR
jgi:excisionase family DNA binding protein